MPKLTGTDIVAIIRAGSDAKVAKLELGAIKITYQGAVEAITELPPVQITQPTTTSQEPLKPEHNLQQEIDEYLLMVTDPVAYEKSQLL